MMPMELPVCSFLCCQCPGPQRTHLPSEPRLNFPAVSTFTSCSLRHRIASPTTKAREDKTSTGLCWCPGVCGAGVGRRSDGRAPEPRLFPDFTRSDSNYSIRMTRIFLSFCIFYYYRLMSHQRCRQRAEAGTSLQPSLAGHALSPSGKSLACVSLFLREPSQDSVAVAGRPAPRGTLASVAERVPEQRAERLADQAERGGTS